MFKDQIKHMVDRFLGWKLPSDFNPDNGISFERLAGTNGPHPFVREPSGTNLFDATQATAMVSYMIEGLPSGEVTIEKIATVEIDPGDGTVKPNLEYVLIRGFSAMGWVQPNLAADCLIENIAQSIIDNEAEGLREQVRRYLVNLKRYRDVMENVCDELEEDFDTVDGGDGQPAPNKAMRLASELKEAIYGPGGY